MRFVTFSLIAALWGCSDPTLQISFEVPEQYRADVDAVVLRILVPSEMVPFTCNQLAFQEVGEETVRNATTQTVTARDDLNLDLSEIPREGNKVLHLEGRNDENQPVVAGCIEVGVIEGQMNVGTVGEPVTVLTPDANDPGSRLPEDFQVDVADANMAVLPGAEVRWRVVGPKGEQTTGTAMTDSNGTAELSPVMPIYAGPVIMDVRARWTQSKPAPIPGYRQPAGLGADDLEVAPILQANPDAIYQVGRIGPNGEIGMAGLGVGEDEATQRKVKIGFYNPTSGTWVKRDAAIVPEALSLGMVTRGGRDRIFTITSAGWIEIDPMTGPQPPVSAPIPGVAHRILPLSCGDDIDHVLIQDVVNETVTVNANRIRVEGGGIFDQPGGANSPRVVGAGCVSEDITNNTYQTIALQVGATSANSVRLAADVDGTLLTSEALPILRSGLGYSPARDESPAYVLGTQFSVEGTTLNRYQLTNTGSGMISIGERDSDQTAGPPMSTAAGDVDGDGKLDVLALMNFGDGGDGKTNYRIFISLGATHNGQHITGMSNLLSARRPRLWLADFNNDGYDDLVIGGTAGFAVLRMGPME